MRYSLYTAFLTPAAAYQLFILTDDAVLYKNKILVEGAKVVFPEMTPENALKQEIVFAQKKNNREVQKRLTIARHAASMQGRVHISLKYAIVRRHITALVFPPILSSDCFNTDINSLRFIDICVF